MWLLDDAKTNNISILGLTYKPNTNLVEESAPYKIAKKLVNFGVNVKAYDPSFPEVDGIKLSKSVDECLDGAKVCFIGTPWKEFKDMEDWQFLKPMTEKPTIIDVWGIQPELKSLRNITYKEIGINDKKRNI